MGYHIWDLCKHARVTVSESCCQSQDPLIWRSTSAQVSDPNYSPESPTLGASITAGNGVVTLLA